MERHLGNGIGFYGNNGEDGSGSSDGGHKSQSHEQGLQPWAMDRRGGGDSDTGSMWSSDEDVWGGEIGGVSFLLSCSAPCSSYSSHYSSSNPLPSCSSYSYCSSCSSSSSSYSSYSS